MKIKSIVLVLSLMKLILCGKSKYIVNAGLISSGGGAQVRKPPMLNTMT